MLAGISFRMIFPNIVSAPGCAACAFATSSAMLARAESLAAASFSDGTQNERSLAAKAMTFPVLIGPFDGTSCDAGSSLRSQDGNSFEGDVLFGPPVFIIIQLI